MAEPIGVQQQSGRCPKCSGEMERGYLRDRAQGRFSRAIEWISGLPEITWAGTVKTRDKARCRVDAFRCRNCGYIEYYARNPQVRSGFFEI